MSSMFSPAFEYIFGKEKKHTLMLGLDSAGKTTILQNLKLAKVVPSISNTGFNVETMKSKTITIISWNLGDKSDDLCRGYYQNTANLIFVVDSTDHQRIDQAREVLHQLLFEIEFQDAPLLIYANKKDLSNAMNTTELTEKLDLHSLINHEWYIQATCGLTGDGLFEGLDWLSKQTKTIR